MMSLFSPFDLSIFYSSYLIFCFILCLHSLTPTFKEQFSSNLYHILVSKILIFFNSLNNSNFSKNFLHQIKIIMVILISLNCMSLFPYVFPLSSQIEIVLLLGISIWASIQAFHFRHKSKGYLSHLIPEGAPLALSVLLFLIELVSNLIRPLTLTIRMVANVLAGHVLISLLYKLSCSFGPSFPLISLFNLIEIFVSLIQSYIFATLCLIYFSECYDY